MQAEKRKADGRGRNLICQACEFRFAREENEDCKQRRKTDQSLYDPCSVIADETGQNALFRRQGRAIETQGNDNGFEAEDDCEKRRTLSEGARREAGYTCFASQT